jgi:DNA-binding NtrC family response regulator
MSAVLGIINSHNADIQVQSRVGKGSTIRVFFNASQSPIAVKPTKLFVPNIERNGVILVVDDEESIRDLYREILTHAGYEVMLAKDGLEAVRTHIAQGHNIDAIVLDLTMPKMNGAKALEIIRSRDTEVPIFIASGYIEDASDLRSGLYTDFIQKPCSAQKLISTLDKAINLSS